MNTATEAPAERQTAPRRVAATSEIEIVGGPGGVSRDALRELWSFREVLAAFVRRHVKVKYKQAAIGVGWAVVQPLVAASLFALFLGRLANVSSGETPYFLFAFAGVVAWGYFSGAVTTSMESLISDQVLLRKVYFPREILPFAGVLAALVDLLPSLLTLLVATLVYGISPSVTWLGALPAILILIAAAAAVGTLCSAINVYYRDVRYVLPFLLQVGLFATPVVYALDVVPEGWRAPYAIFNPIAAAIDALRRSLLEHEWPRADITAGALAFSLILLAASYGVFKRLERGFSDRV